MQLEIVGLKHVAEGLPLLNKEEIYATFWIGKNDQIEQYRLKGVKCAEVLVPDYIDPIFIIGAYVANHVAYSSLCKICDINVIINKEIFFY